MSEPVKSPEAVEQIRRAHESARPTTANPAWQNCHHDCGVLLAYIADLEGDLRMVRSGRDGFATLIDKRGLRTPKEAAAFNRKR